MRKVAALFLRVVRVHSVVSVEHDSIVPLSAVVIANGRRLVFLKKQDCFDNEAFTISRRWTDAKAKFLNVSSIGRFKHHRIVAGG